MLMNSRRNLFRDYSFEITDRFPGTSALINYMRFHTSTDSANKKTAFHGGKAVFLLAESALAWNRTIIICKGVYN